MKYRLLYWILILTLPAGLLPGCSNDRTDYKEVIEKAIKASEQVRSYRVEMQSSIIEQENTSQTNSVMEFVAPDRLHTVTRMSGEFSSSEEMIQIGTTVYTRENSTDDWRIRDWEDERMAARDLASGMLLSLEKLVDIEILKDEKIDGIDCYHFMGKVNIQGQQEEELALLDESDPYYEQRKMVYESVDYIRDDMEFWISKDNYMLRQCTVYMEIRSYKDKGEDTEEVENYGSTTMLRFYDYNEPVEITAPSAEHADSDNISADAGINTANISSRSYYSDQAYLTVDLPINWAVTEGYEYLTKSLEGIVAFNSWNQTDFWAKEVQTGNTVRYSLYTVRDQVPDGGAYVVLSRVWGPPLSPDHFPDEYASNSLESLLDWYDISEYIGGQYLLFFKWGRYMRVDIWCNEHASNATLNELKVLLESWHFDKIPAGDIEWAALQARELLPESVEPKMFLTRAGRYGPRYTEAEVDDDEIVHIRFIYTWNQITLPRPIPADYQFNSAHWWTIDVLPDGSVVLTGEGGAALPN
ncbi:MAG: hypothetical protein JW762_01860 [Dehalococcoidales bacterium]|nr:hypothetical protein [Dehalococcoidales bacterium]